MLEASQGRKTHPFVVRAICLLLFFGCSGCNKLGGYWFESEVTTSPFDFQSPSSKPSPTQFEREIKDACDAAQTPTYNWTPCPANPAIQDGETSIFIPVTHDDLDEVLGRTGPLRAVAAGAGGALVALDRSSQVFVSDETGPWETIDLAPYFPGGVGSILSGAVVSHRILIGTDQGIAWLDTQDGTHGSFSGLPSGGPTIAISSDGKGGALAGISVGFANGQPASIYRCDLASAACAASNSGTSASENGRPASDFASVGSKIYAATWGGGVYVSADGGASWSRTGFTASSRVWRLCASGGNLLAGTLNGLFVSGNGGASWTSPAGLPAGDVHGIAVSGATVYAGVNTGTGTAAAAAITNPRTAEARGSRRVRT